MGKIEKKYIEELCRQLTSEGISELIAILEVELRERNEGVYHEE